MLSIDFFSSSAIASTIETNLLGAIYLSRSAARRMLAQRSAAARNGAEASATGSAEAAADAVPFGGRIIHIGSVVGQRGNAGQAVYAASKAGLHGQETPGDGTHTASRHAASSTRL